MNVSVSKKKKNSFFETQIPSKGSTERKLKFPLEFINLYIGNGALSKTDIENILPIF